MAQLWARAEQKAGPRPRPQAVVAEVAELARPHRCVRVPAQVLRTLQAQRIRLVVT